MNKFVVAILACVASTAFGDSMVRDSSGVMIDVPVDGSYVVEFNPFDAIPESEDSSELPELPDFDEIEYSVYYYYVHQGRSISTTLYINNEEKKTNTLSGEEVCTDSFKFNPSELKPQSIAFTLNSECPGCSIVTVIFWIRLKKDGQYLLKFDKDSPMPLYYRAYSPMFDLKDGSTHHFAYEAKYEHSMFVYKHHDYVSDAELEFNPDDKKYKNSMDGFLKNVTFKKGTNKIIVHGTGNEKNVYLEMGAFESASSTIKAVSFVLLALCALLF